MACTGHPSRTTMTRTCDYTCQNYFNTFREALRGNPLYANLIGNRGTVLEMLGPGEEALEHFSEAEEFARLS